MKTKKLLTLSLSLTMASITAAQAAVTYIDATKANTTEFGGGDWVSGTDYTEGSGGGFGNDSKWHYRSPLSTTNNTNAWIAQGGVSTETPERIVTTFTLPGEGQYNIYGFFWVGNNGTASWDAGFELGNSTGATAGNTLYTNANATNIANLTEASDYFTSESIIYGATTESREDMFEASLGTWDTAVDGLVVTVIIDGSIDSAPGFDNRTRYDGVGYQAVPEPATYALLGGLLALSSVALIRRKP